VCPLLRTTTGKPDLVVDLPVVIVVLRVSGVLGPARSCCVLLVFLRCRRRYFCCCLLGRIF
jgi:hypothetical protein